MKDKEKKYVFKLEGDGKSREIHLSKGMVNFCKFSLVAGAIIFIGSCGYSIYSFLNTQKNFDAVTEVEKAGEIRQEQILKLSKKADSLNETLQNLSQQEQELRIQAGLKPAKEDTPTAENPPEQTEQPAENQNDGQGGPIENLNIDDVSEALNMLEQRTNIRKESLNDFQKELKAKWESMAVVSIIPGSTSVTFDLRKFGGSPSANPNMPSIWPTTGVVTSPYGLRWGGSDFHPGMDIANDMGTPIVATADGVVEYAGWNSGGYGNMVDIDHGNGIMTRYGHASQVVVASGQRVKRGQLIAYMGSTGFSTGPHVHYEIHINGQRVNPVSYL